MNRTVTFGRPDGTTLRFEQAEPVRKAYRAIPNAKRFALGVCYPAGRPDGHGELMAADELERVAWDYARNHRRIGFFHADGTLGHADVVESYIHRGPDWATSSVDGTEVVIKSGDWVLGALFDDAGWNLVVTDAVDGWSMDGRMKRRAVPASAVAR